MISIYDWLRKFFKYEENLHPVFEKSLSRPREMKLPSFVNPEYCYPELGWTAKLGLDYNDQKFRHLVLYVPDRKIEKASDRCINSMLVLPDTNYSLYGLYMNLIAHLQGYEKAKLELIPACDPEKKTIVGFRKDIASHIVECRIKEIEEEKKTIKVPENREAGAEETSASYSLFSF
jgi:hypothetical protein